MGLRRVGHVARALIEAGAPADRPAAVVSRGTTTEQRTVTATLATIEQVVADAELASPAIIVVGEVVTLREQLAWFEHRPLFGTRIAVTRARAQASSLTGRLTELGAQVVEVPAIRIEPLAPHPLDELVAGLGSMDVVVFTSRNGVELCFERLRAQGLDARALAGVDVAVVGTASAEACRELGIEPDVIPPRGARTGIGLLEQLTHEDDVAGSRIAIVRAEQGDDRLHEGLAAAGADVTLVLAYRTVVEDATEAQAAQLAAADIVTFTSESTVRNAVAMLPEGAVMPPAITIGPTTSAAAREAGITVLREADDPSIDALVDALLEHAAATASVSS
jgi:uroporphyrinogen III methyltransferase/synthase